MRFAYLFAAGFLAFGPPAPTRADQDLDTQRLNREAKALFPAVLQDVGVPTRPCELDSAWSSQAIPYEVAHRFLDLQAFADLRGPDSVAPLADVLASVPRHALCGEEEATRYVAGHADAQAAALRALPKDAPSEPLWFTREEFSFPIFDQAYDRAVIFYERLRSPVYVVDDKGAIKRAPPEGGAAAYVYERKAGVWRRVEEIDLFTVN